MQKSRWAPGLGLALGCCAAWAIAQTTPMPAVAPSAPQAVGEIALAGYDAGAVATPSAANAWGGVRTGSEATLSDRVVGYRIQAKLDPDKHTLDGKEQLTWRNRSAAPVSSVYLHLYLNAFRNEGSTFFHEKNDLGFDFRTDVPVRDGGWGWIDMTRVAQGSAAVKQTFVQPDGGPKSDMTVVRLDLPQAVAPGASTTLDIDFNAQLPRVIARTGWFGTFHLVGQWFPKIAVLELPGERGATAPRWNAHEFHLTSEFYADFGSYDVTLDVPSDYRVGATGQLQGTPAKANGRTTYRYVQDDVHDFAWTADKRYAEPLRGTWTGAGSPKVDIQVLYPPEYEASAAPALKATQDSLTYFSRTLGPYPYRTVTVVIPPYNAAEAGGMEYPTFFTAEGYDDVPKGSFTAAMLDFVTIHEFGHGYFYGLLASNEFEEPMLDEGLNEYWDQRMLRDGPNHYDMLPPWMNKLGIHLPVDDPFKYERLSAMVRDPSDAAGASAWNRLDSAGYGSVYSRTATVMRDLEATLGKAAIEKGFKDYYASWKFRHPSIADLRESLAVSTGRRDVVERVFAQNVYAAGKQDDSLQGLSSEPVQPFAGRVVEGGKPVTHDEGYIETQVEQQLEAWRKAHPKADKADGPFDYRTTVTVRRRGVAVPQVLVVTFADGSTRRFEWDDAQLWKRFSFVDKRRAVAAQLDPQQRYYLDANKLDDGKRIEGDASAARRWSADVVALFQALQNVLVNL
ncbi:hypothetical protein SAMN05428989_3060 [Pseudoxanthomonas sp. GM95]|uniref:M1 family metallopeptidase n=1 Tax=Pseudoxanthomonas sp. GM95 TaxID=1881043 RepID=UPI0008B9FBAC|nr:M1 family metallopeptidase [Pseudoxanthomonas sp. GM95]SEM10409.1 hypothetical protein SAMN05428989_3060 [Pseudoxanthomonas sp. GM95]